MKKKLPKKSTLKRKADKLFSQYIHLREKCEWCGKGGETLQTAHIFSRGILHMRYEELNVFLLCAGCHLKAHHEPLKFAEFCKEALGEDVYQELMQMRDRPIKVDYQQVLESLQTKLQNI